MYNIGGIHWAPYLVAAFTANDTPLVFLEDLQSWWYELHVAEALWKLIVSSRSTTAGSNMAASECHL